MKKLVSVILALTLATLILWGCAGTQKEPTPNKVDQPSGDMRPEGEGGWENPNAT